MVLENAIILILMINMVLKANVFSMVYWLFIMKYVMSRAKSELLVRLVIIMSTTFAAQYFFLFINLTANTAPSPYPKQFTGYPMDQRVEV